MQCGGGYVTWEPCYNFKWGSSMLCCGGGTFMYISSAETLFAVSRIGYRDERVCPRWMYVRNVLSSTKVRYCGFVNGNKNASAVDYKILFIVYVYESLVSKYRWGVHAVLVYIWWNVIRVWTTSTTVQDVPVVRDERTISECSVTEDDRRWRWE